MSDNRDQRDASRLLLDEFRRHLEVFYARLKLAPPYNSVEKAVLHLSRSLATMTPAEQQRLLTDSARRWRQYQDSFAQSGLARKHRGIIMGLVRSGTVDLPDEYRPWLELFEAGADGVQEHASDGE
jgi:hypothetical protein